MNTRNQLGHVLRQARLADAHSGRNIFQAANPVVTMSVLRHAVRQV